MPSSILTSPNALIPPFVYMGGKRKIADEVWRRFGNVDAYFEPFCGSCAVLLARPNGSLAPHGTEWINDNDALVANFWRAVTRDSNAVIMSATYPRFQHDLTARRKEVIAWRETGSESMMNDPYYYNARIAGWWLWAINNSIFAKMYEGSEYDQPPSKVKGIHAHNVEALRALIDDLKERLRGVTTLCKDWTALTKKAEGWDSNFYPSSNPKNNGKIIKGVFLDPPYHKTSKRQRLYASDFTQSDSDVNQVADDALAWAIKHGGKMRIAYCGETGLFDVPEGWATLVTDDNTGQETGIQKETVIFSPACLDPGGVLFDLV